MHLQTASRYLLISLDPIYGSAGSVCVCVCMCVRGWDAPQNVDIMQESITALACKRGSRVGHCAYTCFPLPKAF